MSDEVFDHLKTQDWPGQLQTLYDTLPFGIAVFSTDMVLERANNAWISTLASTTPADPNLIVPGANLYDLVPGVAEFIVPLIERVHALETIKQDAVRLEFENGQVSYWDIVIDPYIMDAEITSNEVNQDGQWVYEVTGGQVGAILLFIHDATQRELDHIEMRRTIKERAKEFKTLVRVAKNITSTLEMEPLLGLILDELRAIIDYTAASVQQLDGDRLRVVAYRGPLPQDEARSILYCLTSDIEPEVVFRRGSVVVYKSEPVIINDLHDTSAATERFWKAVELQDRERLSYARSWMGIPLKSRGKVIGQLTLEHTDANAYTSSHADLAQAFANQAVVAIENAELYQRAQELATVKERQRLARDLHDSVTQDLYGLSMMAEAASRMLSAGHLELAQDYVQDLGATAQDALREMRLLIFELRPPLLDAEGLVAALQARLDAVEGRSGLETKLVVEDVSHLPPEVEEGLYRIAREALNNALRHARARTIKVILKNSNGSVRMIVSDDGIGFDLEECMNQGGMGLRGMQERCQRLGGMFTIERTDTGWTKILVEVPVE